MNWLLIVIIILGVVAILKFTHLKHRVFIVLIVLVLLFLLGTFSFVAQNNSIDLETSSGTIQAMKVYFVWLGQSFTNIKTLTANVIGMDWVPEGHNVSELDPRNYVKG